MVETKFKDTEVGRIPEDWEVLNVGRNFFLKGRIGWQGLKADEFVQQGPFLVTGTDFKNGSIDWKKCYHITIERYLQDKKLQIQSKDILITKDGTIGKLAFIDNVPGLVSLNSHLLIIRPTNKQIDNHYIFYHLKGQSFSDYVNSVQTGTTMASLTQEKVASYDFPAPQYSEQTRIANALSSIDNLISSLEKLIEKKKNIKQGTMQQLLTGKKRIKGFSEPWMEKQLGHIGITYSGLTGKTKEDFGTGNAKYITFLNVLNNSILNPKQFEQVVIKDGERQNNCRCGDLFFNTSSETPEEVGICAMLDTSMDNLFLNSFCFGYRLTDSNVAPEYLAYYFRSNQGRKLMTVLAQGVTRYNMSKSAFNNAKILMPSNASEQKAITDVLISMDKEIASLKLKKAKYESIKQGMMQQLLTGKIRLV